MPPVAHTPAARTQDHAALIAALDAADLAGAERAAAESLVASCAGCAALAQDLLAIRGAMSALPVPARRRDYQLTGEDAARLRPTGVRRLLEWLAAPKSSVRPLAASLATLGVVGLLLSAGLAGPGGFLGGAATFQDANRAPVEDPAGYEPDTMEIKGAETPPAAPLPAATPNGAGTPAPAVAGDAASPDPMAGPANLAETPEGVAANARGAERVAAVTLPLPALASLALLAAGVVLIAGRAFARRRIT